MTCANAVAAAIQLVRPTSAITAIVFHFGNPCPVGDFFVLSQPTHGYVLFDMADPLPDLRVTVTADEHGVVTATAPEPMPAPSAAS